jgi:hypothetical protein
VVAVRHVRLSRGTPITPTKLRTRESDFENWANSIRSRAGCCGTPEHEIEHPAKRIDWGSEISEFPIDQNERAVGALDDVPRRDIAMKETRSYDFGSLI